MGKIIKILLLLLFFFVFFLISVSSISAAPQASCPVKIEPADGKPLTDETRKARFIINVGQGNASTIYRMEFNCRDLPFAPGQRVNDYTFTASKLNEDEIFYDLDRSIFIPGTTPCQFSEGKNKQIVLHALINNQAVPQCLAYYDVVDNDNLCKLELKPTEGITSATNLTISGKNLTSTITSQFRLFFDGVITTPYDSFDPKLLLYLDTPDFSPIAIPTSWKTVGRHKIDIRRLNIGPFGGFGQPLCPLEFTVGTPDKPGRVLDTGTLKKGCTTQDAALGICTSGKGLECDPAKPAIKTAIGCIHTNPADLVQDVLKFGLGIGGGLAFLMMLLGAFQMLTSAGNPETLQAGRERLTSAQV
ncbi:hypothetical protein HYU96_04480 [Candidatus Daviesbacteria bacterium]|nr:hypothetical protein [Candidatus Daviesbacteria bacterium]